MKEIIPCIAFCSINLIACWASAQAPIPVTEQLELKSSLMTAVNHWLAARRDVAQVCSECQGRGKYNEPVTSINGIETEPRQCRECSGKHYLISKIALKSLLAPFSAGTEPPNEIFGSDLTFESAEALLNGRRDVVRSRLEAKLGWIPGLTPQVTVESLKVENGSTIATIKLTVAPRSMKWIRRDGKWWILTQAAERKLGGTGGQNEPHGRRGRSHGSNPDSGGAPRTGSGGDLGMEPAESRAESRPASRPETRQVLPARGALLRLSHPNEKVTRTEFLDRGARLQELGASFRLEDVEYVCVKVVGGPRAGVIGWIPASELTTELRAQ